VRNSGALLHIKLSLRGRVLGIGGGGHLLRLPEGKGVQNISTHDPRGVTQTLDLLYLRRGLSLVLHRYRRGSAATGLMTT